MKILLFSLRHALCIALFSVLGSQLYSQGNLQFNQVINLNYSGTQTTQATNSTVTYQNSTITIPNGKVWKIESANVTLQDDIFATSYFHLHAYTTTHLFLMLNNLVIANQIPQGSNFNKFSNFPIWLPAGTYPISLFGQHSNDYGTFNAYGNISAIEFNIIP